jgi:hypothetical protein
LNLHPPGIVLSKAIPSTKVEAASTTVTWRRGRQGPPQSNVVAAGRKEVHNGGRDTVLASKQEVLVLQQWMEKEI